MIASIAIVDHVLDMAFQSQKSIHHDIPEVGSDLATLEVESILLADQVPSEVETNKFSNKDLALADIENNNLVVDKNILRNKNKSGAEHNSSSRNSNGKKVKVEPCWLLLSS